MSISDCAARAGKTVPEFLSIPNSGMGGCDLIPPIQTRFSVRRMSTGGGTFVFLPLEVFCAFSLSAAGKARMGMPVDCLRDCHCKVIPDSGTFYGSPEFRRAYPHRTCLTPLLGKPERLSRKKNMSRPGASKILRKTSDSELGGIHFAHFPGDKGYYKNSSNVSLSGSTAWKSVGKTAVLIILFISPTFRNYE